PGLGADALARPPLATGGGELGLARVEDAHPPLAPLAARQGEVETAVVGVEDHVERLVDDALTLPAGRGDLRAVQAHAERLRIRLVPVVVGHLAPVGSEPLDVAT